MKRELQAFCVGFTWPVVVFLAALAFCVWLTSPVFGDDFDDHLAQLKAQNAAAKPHDHADPKPAQSYRVFEMAFRTGDAFWVVSNRDYPVATDSLHYATKEEAQTEADRLNGKADPFAAKNGGHRCDCGGDARLCTCEGCECPGCGRNPSWVPAPQLGDRKVTDDPSRPFVYGWGDAYGYGHVLGYYRTAAAPAPVYYRSAPMLQPPPRFYGGGGGFNCGPSG